MNCEAVIRAIALYFYGELAPEDEERLESHVDECPGCRREMERQKAVARGAERRELGAPAALLADCRHELMSAVLREASPVREARPVPSAWEQIRRGFAALLAPAARLRTPVAAAALVTMGFFAARITTPDADRGMAGAAPEAIYATVRSVQPTAPGQVRIALDETRRRVIAGSLEDDRIQRLLLAAARDESNPGVRVESVDVLKNHPNSEGVRSALLYALVQDANPGVRLKALEGLKPFTAEPEVRKALAEVLLKDENPGVRIQVIDMLIEHRDGSMVGVLQNVVQRENNSYVRLRCEKALQEMNASVGIF
jgi:hypothetical protein